MWSHFVVILFHKQEYLVLIVLAFLTSAVGLFQTSSADSSQIKARYMSLPGFLIKHTNAGKPKLMEI